MGFLSSWRSVGSVMIVTAHVAVVALVVRSFAGPKSLAEALAWVVVTIILAIGISWPVGLAVTSAFNPVDISFDRACKRCGRREIRPLIAAGKDLFHPATGYRCAACWTIYRVEDSGEPLLLDTTAIERPDSSGIAYLSDPLSDEEMRFFDEGAEPHRLS